MISSIFVVWLLLPTSPLPEPEPLGSMCLADKSASFDHAGNAKMDAPTREILTSHRFGLFSLIYPAMPEDGYPLTFDSDGTVSGTQFDGSRWTLENKELHLRNANDEILRTFRYNEKCSSLTSLVKAGDQSILMEIAIIKPAT